MIDIDKFVASLIKREREALEFKPEHLTEYESILDEQGLMYSDGNIAKYRYIKKGYNYLCTATWIDCIVSYTKGRIYKSDEDGCLIDDSGKSTSLYDASAKDHFVLTQDEVTVLSEEEKDSDFELSEFETLLWNIIRKVSYKEELLTNGEVLAIVDENVPNLLSAARKQMLSEIDVDAMVKAMLADLPSDCTFEGLYRKGIEDTLRKLQV